MIDAEGVKPPVLSKFPLRIRDFLDALAALAEETGVHPQNINFGSTYVNITLEAADGAKLTEGDYALATRINDLSTSKED